MRIGVFILSLLALCVTVRAAGEMTDAEFQARKSHGWAWQPIRAQTPPTVSNRGWVHDPIDQFILSKLEQANLSPAPQADRRSLIRRATFDLIGLPPTPREVEEFVADSSPDAFAKVVDRLLASPHFGECWARHWMDLVRYAETYGHEFDYPIANAWRYRDYLIRAFNADVPYDQFVMEHVAGDLLPQPRLNPQASFNESIIATGFWFFGEQTHAPVDVRQHQCDRLDNQIDVFGKTFLGLTIACARCHDHKFDPIRQADYYALCGYLESSRRQEAMLDPERKINQKLAEVQQVHRHAAQLLSDALQPTPALSDVAVDAIAPSHPMYAWSVLANAPDDALFDQHRRQAISKLLAEQKRADETAAKSTPFMSTDDGSLAHWFAAGWAFDAHPTAAGQIILTDAGFRAAPANRADSRSHGSAARGVLRSPTFTLTRPQILYHLAGQHAQIRLIIDGYMMDQFSALLFAGAAFSVDTKGQFIWHRQAQDVGRYLGHRAHIEIIDDGDGWVCVDQIRFADADSPEPAPPPSRLALRALQDPSVTSRQSLEAAYGAISAEAVDRWRNGRATDEDCQLINWLLDNKAMQPPAQIQSQLDEYAKEARRLDREIPAPIYAPAIADGNGFDENLLTRGNPRTPAAPVARHFLQAIVGGEQPSCGEQTSGRLQLAKQLVDPSDPFVSRVMVNRIWQHLMGRGIVASVDNFGALGEAPSHPELLDHLADRFVRDGWSIKKTIRAIMLSSTYQMSSAATDAQAEQLDPNNVLLHHANLRRLDAEWIRDQMLAVSGRLDDTMFGASVDVYLTPFMDGRGKPATSGPLDGNGRRSIYLAVRRNFLPPMLLAFDMPIPFSTMGRRTVSNVPAQALTLMNDPFVAQQADVWAKRLLSEKDLSTETRITKMYESAFARPPTPKELSQVQAFLDQQAEVLDIPAETRAADRRLWADLAQALFNSKEFIFLN
ncbi:MAG TPA: DUF1549 and DUF1553 domain-containing protein [Humisphaera sp.]|jgi:hypothetical protein|nr:DUF1549 and DUF1553 domain-containing protein [Humisphaera sp.]